MACHLHYTNKSNLTEVTQWIYLQLARTVTIWRIAVLGSVDVCDIGR